MCKEQQLAKTKSEQEKHTSLTHIETEINPHHQVNSPVPHYKVYMCSVKVNISVTTTTDIQYILQVAGMDAPRVSDHSSKSQTVCRSTTKFSRPTHSLKTGSMSAYSEKLGPQI